MNKTALRVLNIEDTSADSELLEAHLALSEFDVVLCRVETLTELREALNETWDIALADYSLPHFNALSALNEIKDSGKDIPVIVVSGTIGESRAIEMMRAGARDFVVKGDFNRLIPAIRRELQEAANRKARSQAEAALEASETNFKQLADAMPQMVWMADPKGHLTFANNRFYNYTGLTNQTLRGEGWKTLVQPVEVLTDYEVAIQAGRELSIEHQLRDAKGDYRWFLTRATPSRGQNKEIIAWYATSTDIHEQKMVAQELERAKVLAEQASAAKSSFLANMSHEIRTPLGAILGFAELMEFPDQSEPERQECISAIRRNGDLLSKVINEILDLSKIESNHMEFETIPFSLPEALNDIRILLDLNARGKGLCLKFQQSGSLPSSICSDPTRLRQILINVIGNAIKFTDAGSITVTSSMKKHSHDPAKVILEFEVKDTGVGIAPEESSRLFQPFVQVDNSMTRRYGGTGLGLNLSRKLAQAMGGNVVLAHSEVSKGSTFLCSIEAILQDEKSAQA